MPRRTNYDPWLFFTALMLVLGGLVMVGSSSNYIAMNYGKNPSAIYFKQGVHVALGLLTLLVAMQVPYRSLNRRWVWITMMGACLSGLILVLAAMPEAGGAHRWILIGPFKFQPSELTKLVVVIFMASVLARKEDRVNDPGSVLIPCGAVLATLTALVLIEPDLGSAMMLLAVPSVMIFAAGLRMRYILVIGSMSLAVLVIGILAEPYRLTRLKAWLDPAADPLGSNFQLHQSLVAVGSGGLTGVGLGQGTAKAFYVPASHTDFIFSIIGEELGLIGTGVVLLAFVMLFWRGMRAAVRAPDRFGFYLALGITSLLVIQALTNMAVCLGMLPTKGLPLPLISYGGSSLLTSMAALGVLVNISQHSN